MVVHRDVRRTNYSSVVAHDGQSKPDLPDLQLLAAAHAAASWVRARRANWTDRPLEAPAPVVDAAPVMEFTAPVTAAAAPLMESSVERDHGPSMVARIAERARTVPPSVGRWLAVAGGGAALVAVAWAGGSYMWRALPAFAKRPAVDTSAPAPRAATAPQPTTARTATRELRVKSTPAGARVLVDGKERGVTPLTLTDLRPGAHEVTIASSAGTVHRSVTVAANETVDIDESIYPGWVAVLAPFDVQVSEDGRALQSDEREQFLLAPGTHDIRLANASLNYATVQHVEVTPGATTTVRLTPPSSTLTVTAAERSEVWLDGARIGDTPLNAAAAPLGAHEVIVKGPGGGERRFTVTIGTSPFTLNADSPR
jgi:hypothetical protein